VIMMLGVNVERQKVAEKHDMLTCLSMAELGHDGWM
jgi:hypothetical protein